MDIDKAINLEHINQLTLRDFREITRNITDDAIIGLVIGNASGVLDGSARVIVYSPDENTLLIMNKPLKQTT